MDQFSLTRPAPGYLRATFDHPPTNFLTPDTVGELRQVLDEMHDGSTRVVVFDSVNPDFFMARYDLAGAARTGSPFSGLNEFADVTAALAGSPTISIAAIRGRVRGGGNEFALACDMRFASRENALLGQPEVGSGLLPAGGGIERLAALVGPARAVEIVVSSDDYDADTAAHYGWINRAVPDRELDAFVDALARRIASFDAAAVSTAKRLLNRHTRPDTGDLAETIAAVPAVAAAAPQRRAQLRERAQAAGADFELNLGRHLGPEPITDPH
jgi:enoyl-CoA hydratase/carnithine racemase